MKNKNKNHKSSHRNLAFTIGYGLMIGSILSIVAGQFIKSPLVWVFGLGIGMLVSIVIGSLGNSNK